MRYFVLILALGLVVPGCDCGGTNLQQTDPCITDPGSCPTDAGPPPVVDAGTPPPPVDAGPPPAPVDAGIPDAGPPPPPPPPTCTYGGVTGRVCAPDQQTWVNGATVTLDATDCNGNPVHRQATSAADGSFQLLAVPPGSWTVHASLGAFQQDTPVTVTAGQTYQIPDNQLCVAQKTVKIAVITGNGDKIENLLDTLKLTYTIYGGTSTTYATQAEPFLENLKEMEQYDLIFVDCAAAYSSGKEDFGANAATIEQNLQQYVADGGSVYASDWALLFAVYAHPGDFSFLTSTGSAVADPQSTNQLMGYAPQTVTATISDPSLAAFVGKSQVSIVFPKGNGVSSLHWGLMETVDAKATVLVSAPSLTTCDGSRYCDAGPTATNVPLAVEYKVTPADQPGGDIIYTSFHNIAQTGPDVAQILKYIVLHL